MKVCLYRKSHFNAAHQLYHKAWTLEKNYEIFGKCANPNFHGHNYELIIRVKGNVDPETGFVMSLELLKKIIQKEIIEYLDHKNLNLEISEFQNLNPTVENISIVIWNRIKPFIPPEIQLKIKVYETPRNFASYKGPKPTKQNQ